MATLEPMLELKPANPEDRIKKSREVLYSENKTGKAYVGTYDQFWADHYDKDGEQLGFQAWTHASDAIEKYCPNKDAFILDFCGGTGQVGKRLHSKGYRNLHIGDGAINMLKHAMQLNVYKQFFVGVVEADQPCEYLLDQEGKYDCILSSMSLSEFRVNVEHMITKVLKPGGVFISLETVHHIEKGKLTGIQWIVNEWADESKRESLPFTVLCDDDNMRHDTFTEDQMKLLVVQKK